MSDIIVCDGVVLMGQREAAAMPCSPKEFHIMKWACPCTFDRAEREEAAARILAHSQRLDTWVGVSWLKLVEMMQEDFALAHRGQELRHQNELERKRVASHMQWRWLKCLLTLGLYAAYVPKPVAQLVAPPELPYTHIFYRGPDFVAEGINELIDQRLLRHVKQDDGQDVFFPTPAMVARILEAQSQQPAAA